MFTGMIGKNWRCVHVEVKQLFVPDSEVVIQIARLFSVLSDQTWILRDFFRLVVEG